MLPSTRQITAASFLYHRADLDRILAAPRYNNRGAQHHAVLAAIAARPT